MALHAQIAEIIYQNRDFEPEEAATEIMQFLRALAPAGLSLQDQLAAMSFALEAIRNPSLPIPILTLTKSEIPIFNYLVTHSPNVVSSTTLLTIANLSTRKPSTDNNVGQIIYRIRQKTLHLGTIKNRSKIGYYWLPLNPENTDGI